MKIYSNLTQLIGHTPLLEATHIEKRLRLPARLLLKIESFNPGGSVKDRAALAMIQEAEKDGSLQPGATIIEPTSGNTGIGLAWIARLKGYRLVLTMPDTMSDERKKTLRALGADIVLTPGSDGMKGAIEEADRLQRHTPGSIIMRQFDNPANPLAHELTTAQEIWRDTDGHVDFFVAGIGTGGTITGTGRGLKAHNPDIQIVGVEPATSAVIEGKLPGPHRIQGIGAGFIPRNYDPDTVSRIIAISDDEAIAGARMLASEEGLLCGFSSGAALMAAIDIAQSAENTGKTIVVLLPDTGDRYLSTTLFQ